MFNSEINLVQVCLVVHLLGLSLATNFMHECMNDLMLAVYNMRALPNALRGNKYGCFLTSDGNS